MATATPLKCSEEMEQWLSDLKKEHTSSHRTDKTHVTLVTQLFRSLSQEGRAINTLLINDGNTSLETLNVGLETATTGLHFIDAILPPLIFLTEYLTGQPSPFTLTRGARLGYSAALFSLVVTSLAVPVTAPFIAIAIAGLGLGFSSFMIGYSFSQRRKTQQERKQIEEKLEAGLQILREIQQQAKEKEEKLISDPSLKAELDQLRLQFQEKSLTLLPLYEQKRQCDIQLKRNSTRTVIEKSIPIIAYSLILTGLVVSLFFPPVGLGILAAGSAIGITYAATKLSAPLIKRGIEWFKERFLQKTTQETETLDHALQNTPTLEKQPLLAPKSEPSEDESDESTLKTMRAFNIKKMPTPKKQETTTGIPLGTIHNTKDAPITNDEEEGEGEGEGKKPPRPSPYDY